MRRTRKWVKSALSDDVRSRFCGQLATMTEAGIVITEALRTIAGEEKHRKFAAAIISIADNVEHGEDFASALSAEPSFFPPFMIAMCRTGEQAGQLPKVLFDLEAYFDRRAQHRANLISVFLYPSIVFLLTLLVTTYLVKKVMPILLDSLDSMDHAVPTGAQILITLNNAMTTILPVLFFLILIFFLLRKICPDDAAFNILLSRLELRLPGIGNMFYCREMSLFLDAFSVMAASGLNMITALTAANELLQNAWLKKTLSGVSPMVAGGKTLSESFKAAGGVDAAFCQMIEVGEVSGTLEQNLVRGRTYYDKAYDKQFKLLSASLEPIVLIVVGVIVGFVVLGFMSILYAIYSGYAGMI